MELRWWWLGLVWLALCGLLAWWFTRGKDCPRRDERPVLLAHTDLLRRSPRYAELVKAEVWRLTAQLAAVGLVLLGTGLLMSRPSATSTTMPEERSRDIVLCLDASGSMAEANEQVMEAYSTIASGLEGDRIGLTIFSAQAVTVFPLTDDPDFITEQLDVAAEAFRDFDLDWFAGIGGSRNRASQIGDGLVSCTERFDDKRPDRSRVLVLASDNDLVGEPIYPLMDAAQVAKDDGIVVLGIGPDTTVKVDEFEDACALTGGELTRLDSDTSTDTILRRIRAMQQTSRENVAPHVVVHDRPAWGIAITTLGVLALIGLATRWQR